MSQVAFYRQCRFDGGLRTGIDIDGIEHWHDYVPGPDDGDAGIIWFIDVRIEGETLPDDPDEVFTWLNTHSTEITTALRRFAEHYEVGLDAGPYPQRWEIERLPGDVDGEVVLSAANRIEGRQLGVLLGELADDWRNILAHLNRMSRSA